ncbi:hypothetical protein ACFLZ0_00045 [Patescibacteria group bacterium]
MNRKIIISLIFEILRHYLLIKGEIRGVAMDGAERVSFYFDDKDYHYHCFLLKIDFQQKKIEIQPFLLYYLSNECEKEIRDSERLTKFKVEEKWRV